VISASTSGIQNVSAKGSLAFCPPEFKREAWAARFDLSGTSVWVLIGYWYPRRTVLREARLNSNFVFRTGWWAESGA
jgi:hypothetical protein